MKVNMIKTAAAMLLTGFAANAFAADPATDSFSVTAEVSSTCTVAADPMDFGSVDPTSATPTETSSDITVTCNDGTAYSASLDFGINGGAYDDMQLAGGDAAYFVYSIWQDNTYTAGIQWGDGTDGTEPVDNTAGPTPDTLTAYGYLAGSQSATAYSEGTYSDTVTVSVSY